MKISVSMLKDYLKCPQLAHNIHVERRGPERKPAVLEVGTLFHEAMESRLKGSPPGKWTMASFSSVSPEARELWAKHKLWLAVDGFEPWPAWEIVATEKALSLHLSADDEIVGRLDAVVKYNGKYWSLQWKTFDSDLLALQERVRLSFHEVTYQTLAECAGYAPWGGTILGACQKLPGYRIVGGKRQEIADGEREAALTLHLLTRSHAVQQSMWANINMQVRELMKGISSPLRNYDQCFGPHGRSRCPFFSVCHEGGSIHDAQFVDLEDRYA